MALQLNEYEIETNDSFVVAGVAKRGTDVDTTALWADLADFEDDFADVDASAERFGVIFELEEDTDEFTYLAGHAFDSTDDLPAEMATVNVPEATYVVFSLGEVDLHEMVTQIDEGLLDETDHETREGPLFQRYPIGEDPTDLDATFELLVPVEGTE